MKFIATIECRLSSKRLPGKLILPLGNSTVIEFLIKRLKNIKLIDEIILATTTKKIDDSLVDIAKKNNCRFKAPHLKSFYFHDKGYKIRNR